MAAHQNNGLNHIDVYLHPREFPQDVQKLFSSAEPENIETGAAWYGNLVDTIYPQHDGVRFYVLRHAGRPVVALPLLVAQKASGKQATSLSNFYSALYAPVIAPELKSTALVTLLRAICAAHAPLGSFRFAPMDPKARTYRRLLHGLRAAGMAPFQFFCFGNWFLPVEESWTGYLASRDGQLRSTIKRAAKKFAAEGGILEIVHGGAALESGLSAFERVYLASWKIPEPYPDFVPGLIRLCAERGWLRLGIARLKDEPIAAQLWIVAGGKANIYKLAYHEGYKQFAPGTLVTGLLMQYVIEQDRVTEVDYLIGDDAYKKSWVSDRRERWGLVAYNPKTASGLLGLGRELTGRTAHYLMRLLTGKKDVR